MSPPRTPTRDRSPQRIVTGVAVSNSVQPSPVGPRTSPDEGLSRRTSWNRAVDDPLGLYGSPETVSADSVLRQLEDEPDEPSYFSRRSIQSEVSFDSPTLDPVDVDDLTRLTDAAAPHWRGEERPDEGQTAAWGDTRRSPASPMRSATLKAVSKHLRRVSLRVVNLAGVQLEDKPMPRTPTEDIPRPLPDREQGEPVPEPMPPAEDELDRSQHMQLRGRTLAMFGPENQLRKAMRATLLWTRGGRFMFTNVSMATSRLGKITACLCYFAFSHSTTALAEKSPKATLTFALASQVGVASAHAPRDATPRNASAQPHQHIQSQSGTWYLQHSTDTVTPFQIAVARQRILSEQSSTYLRHSWNRTDFVAVCSFWIMFGLAVSGKENREDMHLYVFRALSVLRTARLLAVTKGTSTIMHSLKRAGPLLTRVALFVLFAIVLFSIVGVQSFKGSFRRTCVVADSIADISNGITLSQNCGAWIDPTTLEQSGYVDSDNQVQSEIKGFTCPLGQICVEAAENPQNGTQAFDNFFLASMQVVVVASVNTWAPVMYQMMDTDFYFSFMFFIVCVVVLNFWLINLFVAVITNMFGAIRAETRKSAFGATDSEETNPVEEKDTGWSAKGLRRRAPNFLRTCYEWPPVYYFWVALVLVSFGLQASKTVDSSPRYLDKLGEIFTILLDESNPATDLAELILTIAFDVDIAWRFVGYLPQWRDFFMKKNNNLDLVLAIGSSIIQIPAIKHSEAYPWLTIFQLARFYRVILVVPRMRPLLLRVFGNMTGLANMVLFLILTNYIAALVAIQLVRGDLPEDTEMNYSQITLGFIGMYQIFSSENWTDILYNATASEVQFKQAVIVAVFFCGWFFFANFILLQMFIAVINENFDVAEEQKREEQLAAYQRKIQPRVARLEWMDKWNPYRFFKSEDNSTTEGGPTVSRSKSMLQRIRRSRTHARKASYHSDFDEPKGFIAVLRKFFALDPPQSEDVPMQPIRKRRPTLTVLGDETIELERHLEILSATNPNDIPDDRRFEREQRSRKAEFIRAHPTFDKTFWILSQQNPLRRFCQMLVTPSNGDRIYGRPPSPVPQAIFQLVIMVVVISGIVIAAVATPVYRREYFRARGGRIHLAWFDIAEATFGFVLVLELIIKVIADGFIFTPNAYVLSVWNLVDLAILAALLSNVITSLVVIGGISRLTRSLKAFRALRLVTLVGRMRETFHSVMFAGASRIFEAGLLAMLYMLPYACWGLNIFSGRFYLCNDDNAEGKADCIGESQTFSNSVLDNFFRNAVFLFLALVFALDIVIRLSGLGWRSFKANGWNLFDIVVVIGNFATGIPIVFGSQGLLIEQLQKLFLVSIAFKLVQKSDNLNQLFKTAVASLPAIMNLFLLWFTLFIFYGIVFMEVFGLTRWDTAETHNQNYSSFGNALLMLAFMSTGEGWNQYMHDYTVEYPRCQNSSPTEPDSDCGSAAWAYFLFISWNILSMYIFVNMFTGVVVENFSYVFQLTGEMSISREEMRAFKKVWAEFDPDRTGFISRKSLVPFFSKLRGVFEVRLYPETLSPQALVEATKMNNPLTYRSTITGEEIPVPLNMRRLNSILNGVDYTEVRARRQVYNRLFYEARILEEEPGISFTNMLLLLAHHKLIDDSKALRQEAYRRKITTDHVSELVNLDRVRSLLKMVYHRRNYLQAREQLEAERRIRSGVPAIIVEDLPSSPPPTTSRDIAGGLGSPIASPRESFEGRASQEHTGYFGRVGSVPSSPITSTPIPGHQRQISDVSMLSADITSSPTIGPRFSQESTSVARRPSIWGDIIQAAAEKRDEEPAIRRSNSQ
ncbi:calcium channel protein [Ceratobasidium sp. 423]|nr:calcium channel protein [Ceratobasidium sp. 423]